MPPASAFDNPIRVLRTWTMQGSPVLQRRSWQDFVMPSARNRLQAAGSSLASENFANAPAAKSLSRTAFTPTESERITNEMRLN